MMTTQDDSTTTDSDADSDADAGFQVRLRALGASVDRLAALVRSLTPEQLRQQAYPSEWTVADVLSHLGSGAVLTKARPTTRSTSTPRRYGTSGTPRIPMRRPLTQ